LPFETAIIERYEALWGRPMSSGAVSRLNQKLYRHLEAWRNRAIEGEFAYLDGVILKRSWAWEVRKDSGRSWVLLTARRKIWRDGVAFCATCKSAAELIGQIERIIREIRRRTRVVGAFPDGKSALMLVAARLRHIASTKWGTRRYLVMETLPNPTKQRAAACESDRQPPTRRQCKKSLHYPRHFAASVEPQFTAASNMFIACGPADCELSNAARKLVWLTVTACNCPAAESASFDAISHRFP
jgi:hypothetical protein